VVNSGCHQIKCFIFFAQKGVVSNLTDIATRQQNTRHTVVDYVVHMELNDGVASRIAIFVINLFARGNDPRNLLFDVLIFVIEKLPQRLKNIVVLNILTRPIEPHLLGFVICDKFKHGSIQ
jgi:hypothetical protein